MSAFALNITQWKRFYAAKSYWKNSRKGTPIDMIGSVSVLAVASYERLFSFAFRMYPRTIAVLNHHRFSPLIQILIRCGLPPKLVCVILASAGL